MMMPVGFLMAEHRTIEKMVTVLEKEVERLEKEMAIDAKLIDATADFFRTYADKCHHGKEEDILFKALNEKSISDEHKKIMDGLVADHAKARETITGLLEAKEKNEANEAISLLKTVISIYPPHIQKEDKQFFIPVMEYFSEEEKQQMASQFKEFDRNFIHSKYKAVVAEFE